MILKQVCSAHRSDFQGGPAKPKKAEKTSSLYCVMLYFWWGHRGNLNLITLGSERVESRVEWGAGLPWHLLSLSFSCCTNLLYSRSSSASCLVVLQRKTTTTHIIVRTNQTWLGVTHSKLKSRLLDINHHTLFSWCSVKREWLCCRMCVCVCVCVCVGGGGVYKWMGERINVKRMNR